VATCSCLLVGVIAPRELTGCLYAKRAVLTDGKNPSVTSSRRVREEDRVSKICLGIGGFDRDQVPTPERDEVAGPSLPWARTS
jgi:hypothetical protein